MLTCFTIILNVKTSFNKSFPSLTQNWRTHINLQLTQILLNYHIQSWNLKKKKFISMWPTNFDHVQLIHFALKHISCWFEKLFLGDKETSIFPCVHFKLFHPLWLQHEPRHTSLNWSVYSNFCMWPSYVTLQKYFQLPSIQYIVWCCVL